MMDKELIALLPPDDRRDGTQVSDALVRFADGRMAIEKFCATMPRARDAARFRHSSPIIDPMTREVIGYEMERVLLTAGA
jgi:hypothetical protein